MLHRTLLALAFLAAACATPDAPGTSPGTAAAEDSTFLELDPQGLRVIDAGAGTARLVAFGEPAEDAVAIAEAARGPGLWSENDECGAGPLRFVDWPDLQLVVQDSAFVGWSQRVETAGYSSLATAAGLAVSSTRAELDAAYAATVEETSLGTEFSTGDLFGILSGPGPDATVDYLWAGVSCTFR